MDRSTRDGRHSHMAEYPDHYNSTSRGVRISDQGLVSEEDAAAYLAYPDPSRMDVDIDDDPNNSLTSQTLNADGTPKRPMNAFMIFARRRRPQVSAENQSMRTGDVSKILSREWNAMDSSEKQFYLDQAKQLKDTFNLKYPDYVYRRRPNNSRKKRRSDSSAMATDSASGDMVDEQSDDISPVDYHDSQERYGSSGPEARYPSAPPDATYDSSYMRTSSYQPAEPLYHPYPTSDRRAAFMPSHDTVSSDQMRPSTPPPYYPSFVANASNPQAASYFPGQARGDGQWNISGRPREDLGRPPVQSWSQSGQESSLHSVDNRRQQYQVTQTSQMPWAGSSPPEPLASNNSTIHASSHNPSHGFPTLNSPFYPPQNSPHLYAAKRSSSHMMDTAHQYGTVSHAQGSSAGSRQETAYHYPSVPTMQAGYTQSSGPAVHQYHAHSRNAITSVPSAQSLPVYPHQQSMNPNPPTGSTTEPSSQL